MTPLVVKNHQDHRQSTLPKVRRQPHQPVPPMLSVTTYGNLFTTRHNPPYPPLSQLFSSTSTTIRTTKRSDPNPHGQFLHSLPSTTSSRPLLTKTTSVDYPQNTQQTPEKKQPLADHSLSTPLFDIDDVRSRFSTHHSRHQDLFRWCSFESSMV